MADDTKPNAAGLALLNAQMDSLAREVGALGRDDPKRADLVKEIFRLAELVGELVSLVVVENRFFGIGAQIFLSQLPYNERSLNSQRLSIPPSRGFQR